MPTSSRPEPVGAVGEVTIVQWQAARLLHPSVIKPIIATLEHTLIRRPLGQLQLSNQQTLSAVLQNIIG
jgi:mRNA interferase MazF